MATWSCRSWAEGFIGPDVYSFGHLWNNKKAPEEIRECMTLAEFNQERIRMAILTDGWLKGRYHPELRTLFG